MTVEYEPDIVTRIRDEMVDMWSSLKDGYEEWKSRRWLRRNSLTGDELDELVRLQGRDNEDW